MWKSLIQNPTFISTHLHHSSKKNKQPLLFFRLCTEKLDGAFSNADSCEIDKELYALHWDDNENFNQHTMFDFPFQDQSTYGLYRVVGTCNGLVCIADDLFDCQYFILWNPCLRKFLVFPRHDKLWFRTQPGNDVSTGIGFDAKTNDYKVLWFLTFLDVENQGEAPPEVEVYLLATGEWKTLTALPPTGAVCYSHPQPFVNGAMHWLAWKKTKDKILLEFIMVFDLGDETFRLLRDCTSKK